MSKPRRNKEEEGTGPKNMSIPETLEVAVFGSGARTRMGPKASEASR